MGGTAWCETNIVIESSDVSYKQISNIISKSILRTTLITFFFVLADDLQINILKFVAGHGTVVQLASLNIVFGCKQQ